MTYRASDADFLLAAAGVVLTEQSAPYANDSIHQRLADQCETAITRSRDRAAELE